MVIHNLLKTISDEFSNCDCDFIRILKPTYVHLSFLQKASPKKFHIESLCNRNFTLDVLW